MSPRRKRTLIAGGAAATLLVVVGAAGWAAYANTPTPATSTAPAAQTGQAAQAAPSSNAGSYQCIGIRRAYKSWLDTLPSNLMFNEVGYSRVKDAGDRLLQESTGWDDQPSKNLAAAIANYNYELTLANAQLVIGGETEPGQVDKTADVMNVVGEAYRQVQLTTCA